MQGFGKNVMLIAIVAMIPIFIGAIPLYETDFVVDTSETSTDEIIDNTLAFLTEISNVMYSRDNITVTSLM